MTQHFPLHDEATAPAGANTILAATKKELGMIPNLSRIMANAPALLTGYETLWNLFEKTSLSELERQVVHHAASYENDCEYCVPWHSLLCAKAGMRPEEVDALRSGRPLADRKLEGLRSFTRQLVQSRGNVSAADLEAFLNCGYSPQQALEVVLGIAMKTMSNYSSGLAGPALDDMVKRQAWSRPRIRS